MWEELYETPEQSEAASAAQHEFVRQCEEHDRAYLAELRRVERGYRFRRNRIPHQGVHRLRRVLQQYGRVVWKRGDHGQPVPVREEFPDQHTLMNPVRMLELAVECGVSPCILC